MPSTEFPRRRFVFLLPVALLAGGCSPSVSKIEMSSAQTRVETAQSRQAMLEKEFSDLNSELKALSDFKGAGHEKNLLRAAELRKEKDEMEALKKDLDARLEKFAADTRKCQDTLVQDKK
jgi:predicted  nucleic acid-binding Zn-ribbon protein